jgi:hypothetical protein
MSGVSGWWPVLVLCAMGCSGESRLTVKGRVAAGISQAPLEATLNPDGETATKQQPLRTSTGPVSQVLVYRNFGNADLSPVDADGHFSVDVSRSQPVGLVFLDPTEAVVGTLALADGVSALPVSLAGADVNEVDLATIAFDGGVATPGSNPLDPGGALELDATEREVYALQSALFSSIVRNLDMNHDDVIDVRSTRPYWLMFEAIYNSAPATQAPSDAGVPQFNELRLLMSDRQPVVMAPTPELRTPGGQVFTRVNPETRWAGDRRDATNLPSYVWMAGNQSSAFTAGAWSITYGSPSTRLDFDVAYPLASQQHIVAADVWWEQPSPDTLTLHWRWALANGNPSGLDVARLITLVIPGIRFTDDTGTNVDNPPPSQTSFTFQLGGKQPQTFFLSVRDAFGNEYTTQGPVR